MKNKKSIWICSVKLLLSSAFILGLASCTIEPKQDYKFIPESSASWDGNKQNSGLISYDKEHGFMITEGAANRYKDLTVKFGKTYIPKLSEGEGLERVNGNYYLSNRYMTIFAVLNQKNKRGDSQ